MLVSKAFHKYFSIRIGINKNQIYMNLQLNHMSMQIPSLTVTGYPIVLYTLVCKENKVRMNEIATNEWEIMKYTWLSWLIMGIIWSLTITVN